MKALGLFVALAVAGCATRGGDGVAPPPTAVASDWRAVATPNDRERLRNWRTAWMRGLSAANTTHRDEIASQGALFDPDGALPGAALPSGAYRCRVIKMGSSGTLDLTYIAYPAFRCRVDGDRFVKETGSQRPIGTLLPDGDRRQVFLGTMSLGDETLPVRYGRDRERDMVGLVERIGPGRWRLVFPYPHFESLIDVIELVPAGA